MSIGYVPTYHSRPGDGLYAAGIEPAHPASGGSPRRGMAAGVARDWDTWARTLGILVGPYLDRLQADLPSLTGALLCTAEGLCISGKGIPTYDFARLARLSAELIETSAAHHESLGTTATDTADPEVLTMFQYARSRTVVLRFECPIVGPLLLVASARETSTQTIVDAARRAARTIRASLGPLA